MIDTPETAAAGVDAEPADKVTPNDQNETEGTDVNSATPEEDSVPAGEPTTPAAPADSPEVHALAVEHKDGVTTITAKVFSPLGWIEKRLVLVGRYTAAKIAVLVTDIEKW